MNTPDNTIHAKIQRFWNDFVRAEEELKSLALRERVERANGLFAVHFEDSIALEVEGGNDDPVVALIFSAHGRCENFPLLMALVGAAPVLQYHRVVAFRQRVINPDFTMGMDGFDLAVGQVRAACERDGGQIGLHLKFDREIPDDMRDHARNMAFIMLDHVLGEYDFAVKVGFVDFDAVESALEWTSLSEFAARFDAYWRTTLGRSGVFPDGEAQWAGLRAQEDDNELLIMVNTDAQSVAMRADLSHALTLCVEVDADTLETVQDLQEAIGGRLASQQAGLLVCTVLNVPQREAIYYVGDPEQAGQIIRQALREARIEGFELKGDFDPSWKRYFGYAVHLTS